MSEPVAELIQYPDKLQADPELLHTLTVDIEDLRKKLQGELMEGMSGEVQKNLSGCKLYV
ncbi:MAG: hypothetical protein U9P81_04785 [Euryarchaeota archaeon]|nr:hypothetical protein [Euryarchaeota archaeon]